MRKIERMTIFEIAQVKIDQEKLEALAGLEYCSEYAPGIIELDLAEAGDEQIRKAARIIEANPVIYLTLKAVGVDYVHFYAD